MCLEDISHELNNVVGLVNLVLMDLAQSVQFSSYHFFSKSTKFSGRSKVFKLKPNLSNLHLNSSWPRLEPLSLPMTTEPFWLCELRIGTRQPHSVQFWKHLVQFWNQSNRNSFGFDFSENISSRKCYQIPVGLFGESLKPIHRKNVFVRRNSQKMFS